MAAPKGEDLQKEVGPALVVTEEGPGRKVARLDLRKAREDERIKRRYDGALKPWRDAEEETGRELSARTETVELRHGNGRVERVPAQYADGKARKHGLSGRANGGVIFTGGFLPNARDRKLERKARVAAKRRLELLRQPREAEE
jgi:hypothetical protein